jgi:hypothetical protein
MVFSLAYLVSWTGHRSAARRDHLVCVGPLALMGILSFYFGGYGRIPELIWVILGMLLGAGLIFLTSMLFVYGLLAQGCSLCSQSA